MGGSFAAALSYILKTIYYLLTIMSYKTYTTFAIVCGSRASNTSDKSYLLFTKDGGMIWATAKSVREERSRQRYALQDFSLIKVSLVKGKAGWRVGSVESINNAFSAASSKEARGAVTMAVRALRQYIHGEESIPSVFDDVKTLFKASLEIENLPAGLVDRFVFRMLYALGYIARHKEYENYLDSDDWYNLPPLPERVAKMMLVAKKASHL